MQTGDAVPSDGLLAEYFADTALDQLASRVPSNRRRRLAGLRPRSRIAPGGFSARGRDDHPLYSESYTFTADCLGGVRVWVDDASSSMRGPEPRRGVLAGRL